MMKAIAVGLGLPHNYFVDKCSLPMSILALWHYPPHPAETDSWGVGPHTDYGMWTCLLQDDVGGLEVEITEGQWVEVKPIPGTVYYFIPRFWKQTYIFNTASCSTTTALSK